MKRSLIALVCLLAIPAAFAGGPRKDGIIHAKNPIRGQYIVVLGDRVPDAASVADEVSRGNNARILHVYDKALKGFAIELPEPAANALLNRPDVKYVEEDGVVTADTTQSVGSQGWGLDRIDQRNLPLDLSYTYNTTASNVHAYIVDTGIFISHTQFGGRASVGVDEVGDGQNGIDCNGHGTHVAGTVGGSTWGVAKSVTLVAVRVLNCQGSGTNSGVIAGVNWVAANAIKPAVANMSLGGGASQALDDAVTGAVNNGVVFCVAAGNGDPNTGLAVDACTTSPARAPAAITVSATDNTDHKPTWANTGTCVDIFAPGVNITSAWDTSTTATNTISGTSMATPHVCGTAALYVGLNPTATPASVASALINNSTSGVVIGAGSGSPNRLLFIGGGGTPAPTISGFSPASGGVGSSVTITGSNFTGATSVKFNGQSASFSVNSSTQITATVPNCSSTGTISVTTAGGTANSSSSFSVTGCGGGTSQLLLNPGFESGAVNWTATAGVIDSSASEPAHSGAFKAWLDGYGQSHTDSIYQTVTIPSSAVSATLTFWLHIDTAETTTTTAFDTLNVQIRNTSNTVLSTLATYSNLNKNTGYVQKSFDVTSFRGQTIRVYFLGVEDSSLQTSFVIDDTALNVN
jgi:subtilisin family serine protease